MSIATSFGQLTQRRKFFPRFTTLSNKNWRTLHIDNTHSSFGSYFSFLLLFGLVWFALIWFGWFGLVWFGLVWFFLLWFFLLWLSAFGYLLLKKE